MHRQITGVEPGHAIKPVLPRARRKHRLNDRCICCCKRAGTAIRDTLCRRVGDSKTGHVQDHRRRCFSQQRSNKISRETFFQAGDKDRQGRHALVNERLHQCINRCSFPRLRQGTIEDHRRHGGCRIKSGILPAGNNQILVRHLASLELRPVNPRLRQGSGQCRC